MSTDSAEWTIDELSAASGVPTRTIREYRTVGVLAPPVKRGRVGVYDRTHFDRLRLIARLQSRGYSLAGIRDLLDAWSDGRSLGTVLDLDEPGPAALDEAPAMMTADDLDAVVGGLGRAAARRDAERVGLVAKMGERYAVRSPALLRLVAEATAAGVSLTVALELAGTLRSGAEVQANGLAEVLVGELWDPDGDNSATATLARRVRLLMAQAAASLVVGELGRIIEEAATTPEGRGLDGLLDSLRIGAMTETSPEAKP
jgi:DNA-binding transcriptional MerR regulator